MTGITRQLAVSGVPLVAVTMLGLAAVAPSAAQGTAADYERARALKTTYEKAAGVVPTCSPSSSIGSGTGASTSTRLDRSTSTFGWWTCLPL